MYSNPSFERTASGGRTGKDSIDSYLGNAE